MLGCSLSTLNVLVNDGSVLVTGALRVITDDGSAVGTTSTTNVEKGGIPLSDGFVQVRVT